MGNRTADHAVALLGPLEVRVAGRTVEVPPGQQRRLVASLALQAGQPVPVGTLVDHLWGEDLPADPRAGVQNNVQRLRRLLGPGAIITVTGGYQLNSPSVLVDAGEFLKLADRIDAEPGRRDLIDQALDLWRGEALSDIGSPALERIWLPVLTERRLTVLEARADDDIDHDRYAGAIADLRDLVVRFPLRESLWQRLMIALQRSGRVAEALEAYEDMRSRLADELGTDPASELQQLHHRLLTSPRTDADDAGRPVVVPRELPATPRSFTGRTAELSRIENLLATSGESPPVVGIHGPGGVGKSALAVTAAHRVGGAYPDGQLYLDLAGTTPGRVPVEPQAALARLLYSLGVRQAPTDVDAAAARYRSELDGKRVLVVLDNALDEAQLRPLLPGNASCGVLITSRRMPAGLHEAVHLQLDVLSEEQSRALLGQLVGSGRTDAEPEATGEIARLCGHLPLGLRIAAARIASRTSWRLASFTERLTDTAQRLHVLRSGDQDLTAAFEVSYRQLTREQARAFRLCSIPGGPDLELDAAAAVLDHTLHETEDLLETLVDHALLETHKAGRYRYHDLTRLYAHDKSATEEPAEQRGQAAGRLLAYYTATIRTAIETISPGFKRPTSLLPSRLPGRGHTTPDLAMEWMIENAPHLFAAIEAAIDRSGLLAAGADLLYHTYRLQNAGFDRGRMERVAQRTIEAAMREDDHRSEALARFQVGLLRQYSRDVKTACTEFDTAAGLASRIGDRRLVADCRYAEAWALQELRLSSDVIRVLEPAIQISRELGDTAEEAQGLTILATAYMDRGDIEQALVTVDRSIQISRGLGAPGRLASANYVRGVVLRRAGRLEEAGAALLAALDGFRTIKQAISETYVLYHLAETSLQSGDYDTTADYAGQCRKLSREIGSDFGIGRARTVLGKMHLALGDRQRARIELRAAYEIFQAIGARETDDVHALLEGLDDE